MSFTFDSHRYGVHVMPEIILDPDGERIQLDGLHSIRNVSPITLEGYEIDPFFQGETQFEDAYIELNDPDEFFNPISQRPGYHLRGFVSGLLEIPSTNYIILNSSAGYGYETESAMQIFIVGDIITIISNTTGSSEQIQITEVSQDGRSFSELGAWGWHPKLYFESGALTGTYAIGDIVTSVPILGKRLDINLKLKYQGAYEVETIFRGIVRELPEWRNGIAILKVDNLLGYFMQAQMKIHAASPTPTQRVNSSGALASTIAWTTQTGDGTLSGVTVYTGSNLGQWIVTFSSATEFTVTGPNCQAKAGTTVSDFYDQTGASDSQIKIALTSWGGTPAADDVLTFWVSANFEEKSMCEIADELIRTYGGVSTDYIYQTSGIISGIFKNSGSLSYVSTYSEDYLNSYTFSFCETGLTIGKALASILPSTSMVLTTRNAKLCIDSIGQAPLVLTYGSGP